MNLYNALRSLASFRYAQQDCARLTVDRGPKKQEKPVLFLARGIVGTSIHLSKQGSSK
jgi:hypothetical protein